MTDTRLWGIAAIAAAVGIYILLLGGCSTVPRVTALPEVKEYSAKFQTEMKAELPAVRANAPNTYSFVQDSVKLRDKIRAGKAVDTKQRQKGFFKLFSGR